MKLCWKKSLLVICKILGLFVNILTADRNSFLLNKDHFRQQIQMQLSQKQNLFSQFVSAFFKSRSNFEHFQKNDDPHS